VVRYSVQLITWSVAGWDNGSDNGTMLSAVESESEFELAAETEAAASDGRRIEWKLEWMEARLGLALRLGLGLGGGGGSWNGNGWIWHVNAKLLMRA